MHASARTLQLSKVRTFEHDQTFECLDVTTFNFYFKSFDYDSIKANTGQTFLTAAATTTAAAAAVVAAAAAAAAAARRHRAPPSKLVLRVPHLNFR